MNEKLSVFLETSALVRLLKKEWGWETIEITLSEAPEVIASALLCAEVERAVRQSQLPGLLESFLKLKGEDPSGLPYIDMVVEVRRELLAAAGAYEHPIQLKTGDAIHVATFEFARRSLRPGLVMLSCDKQVKKAVSHLFGQNALIEIPDAPLKTFAASLQIAAITLMIEVQAETPGEAHAKAREVAVSHRGPQHPKLSWIDPVHVNVVDVSEK